MSVKNRNSIVTDGLVFYVDAGNENSYAGSGTTWTDLVGSNDGTLEPVAGPTYDSANGGSIAFDGADDYAAVSNPSATTAGTTNSSISVWFKTGSDVSSNQTLYSERDGTTHIFSKLRINSTKTDYIFLTPSVAKVLSSSASLSTNTWYYFTGTKSGNDYKIYLNGQLDISSTEDVGSFSTGGTIATNIGKETVGLYLNGNIAQIKIYNRALSSTEITQNYNALKNRFI